MDLVLSIQRCVTKKKKKKKKTDIAKKPTD